MDFDFSMNTWNVHVSLYQPLHNSIPKVILTSLPYATPPLRQQTGVIILGMRQKA